VRHRKINEVELRNAILCASEKIVHDRGLEALTMRRLAEVIGYSPTAIYLYFRNREEIVAELGRKGLGRLAAELGKVPGELPPLERLLKYAEAYLRFSSEQADAYRLIFMADAALSGAIFFGRQGSDRSDDGRRAFACFIRAFMELSVTDPAWAKCDPLGSAEVFWTSLHGIASLKATCGKLLRTDMKSLAGLAIPSLLDGMAKV
jgi:AcrR family transcriptional regulator